MKKSNFKYKSTWLLSFCLLLNACTIAPSVNVLGAYFPSWMFCIIGGVSLTVIVHLFQSDEDVCWWLKPAALIYPLLAVLFTLSIWLIFFF